MKRCSQIKLFPSHLLTYSFSNPERSYRKLAQVQSFSPKMFNPSKLLYFFSDFPLYSRKCLPWGILVIYQCKTSVNLQTTQFHFLKNPYIQLYTSSTVLKIKFYFQRSTLGSKSYHQGFPVLLTCFFTIFSLFVSTICMKYVQVYISCESLPILGCSNLSYYVLFLGL